MSLELRRSLSLFDVIALGINGVIGTGIFLLPGRAADMMGPASIFALLFAALLSFLIALCFAEVGSSYKGTGGPYLYALGTFGDVTGFGVGWMELVVTLTSWAAMVNGLATAASPYVPELAQGPWRNFAMVGFMTLLTLINLLGAKLGARISNFFTIAKLLPLILFVAVGLSQIDTAQFTPFAPHGYGSSFFETSLLLLYAYVGFEALVVPAGEMKKPQHSVPIALLSVLAISVVVYVGVLVVATGTLPNLAGHENPVVGAARNFMPGLGASVIAAGVLISIVGVNTAQVLVGPRRVFSLAEHGHLPRILARVNSRGVPHVSLIVLLLVSAAIAVSVGEFKTLAMVSVVARFAQYITTCLSAIIDRRRPGHKEAQCNDFRLPFGPLIPALALLLCAVLLLKSAQHNFLPFLYGGYALASGVPVYLLILYTRRKRNSEYSQ